MLTISQESALSSLEEFLASRNQVFVLTGAAGTGKTFLLRELAAIVAGVVATSG
jgi:predicted ATPase